MRTVSIIDSILIIRYWLCRVTLHFFFYIYLFSQHYCCNNTNTVRTQYHYLFFSVNRYFAPKAQDNRYTQYFSRSLELTSWRCHRNDQARQPAATTDSTLNPRNRGSADARGAVVRRVCIRCVAMQIGPRDANEIRRVGGRCIAV